MQYSRAKDKGCVKSSDKQLIMINSLEDKVFILTNKSPVYYLNLCVY